MKVVTILGTRPEIIRLSRIIPKLDALCVHVLVHTGQNYDSKLSDIFFHQLGVRQPDHFLGANGTFGEQVSKIMTGCEALLQRERPDRFLVLGDTNSSLGAIMAKRLGVPVYHMEAGNRCFDDRVPEEINRRVIDHSSDILMPYTERSRHNLLAEGIASHRIFVTGNPIFEVLEHYDEQASASTILQSLALQPQEYILVTIHRAENVDIEERLKNFTHALTLVQSTYGIPVIVSTHPRTRARMREFGIAANSGDVRFLDPFGFFDFVTLEKNAFCIMSDSGTVQEEASIFGVPNVTLRDVTERPETVECGSNILSGSDPDRIMLATRAALACRRNWRPPVDYLAPVVSDTVTKILLGHEAVGT